MLPEFGATEGLLARLEELASRVDLSLSTDDRQRLLGYLGLVQRWTRVYNLTAVRSTGEMFTHHLMDCLAIVQPFRRGLTDLAQPRILDVGSGAGLPGAVLAILNPGWQVSCVDAVAKKATFIRQVAAELGLSNLQGVHGRVETPATFGSQRFDLITSRAFASLKDFTALTQHLLAERGCWAAMKAKLSDAECAELPPDIAMFHVEQLEVPDLDANRCLVWMKSGFNAPSNRPEPRQ